MSVRSRARKLQRLTRRTYQQALQHLQALNVDVRTEGEYVKDLEYAATIRPTTCGCGRSFFADSRAPLYRECPFCTAVAAMVEWFFDNFEDPANGVPHDSGEGGYQYLFGGPYYADEELQEHFEFATERMREAAVEVIQGKGWEWVRIGDY